MTKPKTDKKDVKENVMDQINKAETKMKPKWHFHLLSFLLGLSLFATSVFAALFINLTALSFRERELLELFNYGNPGRLEFVQSIPWLLVTMCLITVCLAIIVVRHYKLSYKHRFYGLLGMLVLVIVTMSGVLAVLDVEDSVSNLAPIRGAGRFDDQLQDRRVGGEIIEMDDDFVVVENVHGKKINVDLSEIDNLPKLEVGQHIGVLGSANDDGSFEAERLRIKNEMPPRPGKPRRN